jgi:hypothetical protein
MHVTGGSEVLETVTFKAQVAIFPAASVAVHIIVVVPKGRFTPVK